MTKSWNVIDRDAPRPPLQELIDSWSDVHWETQDVRVPALDRYLDEVARTHANGGFLLGRWRAVEYPDTTAWFASRNRFDEYEMFRLLFSSDEVRTGLPELKVPAHVDRSVGGLSEVPFGALTLDGTWASLIVHGGAYTKFAGSAREAKDLAVDAVHAVVGDRFEDFRVDVSYQAWTPWFYDIAWDATFVLTDKRNAEITVLCVTDTD